MVDVVEEDFIYLNTSYADKSSVLVVEVSLVRTAQGKQSFASCGYAILPIFEFSGETSAMVVKGTPRQISSGEAGR
jgi:hypothetical protein